jgi:hypothetical protein
MINIGYSEVIPCYSPCSPYVFFFEAQTFYRGALSSSICVINFRFRCSKSACITTIPARIWVTSASAGHGKHGKRDEKKKPWFGSYGCMMLHDVAVQETKKLNHVAVWSWYDHDMMQLNMYLSNWKTIRLHRTHLFYIGSVLKQGAMKQSLNVAHQCMYMPNMQL